MESTLHALGQLVPAPKKIKFNEHFLYRYEEKNYHQAIIQKLARYIMSLKSAHILLEHGYLQDQATVQRVMDEIQEDIAFLGYGIIFNEFTKHHEVYLAAFYQEEFDLETGKPLNPDKPMVPRAKIRAFLARMQGEPESSNSAKIISKAYSGYVHAASPHIMDLYYGNPPRFQVNGILSSPLWSDHKDDIWNYFYRGILAFSVAAKAFGQDQLCERILGFSREFSIQREEKV